MNTEFPLETRTGLPDALRVLLDSFPRDIWETHPGYAGLIQFWLDRHMMFRRLLDQMQTDTEKLLDGGLTQRFYAAHLARYGGMFVQELHGHHSIEDHHYFPKLIGLDPRLSRGFDILDKDHHALDGHLNDFVAAANTVLQAGDDKDRLTNAAGAFHGDLQRLNGFLNRHLIDEEDLIVPVVLKHGAPDL